MANIKQRLAERKKAIVAALPGIAAVVLYVVTGVNVSPDTLVTIGGVVVSVVSAIVVERTRNAPPSP